MLKAEEMGTVDENDTFLSKFTTAQFPKSIKLTTRRVVGQNKIPDFRTEVTIVKCRQCHFSHLFL